MMRGQKLFVVAVAAALFFSALIAPARAEDTASQAQIAQVPVTAKPFSWTGLHIGATLG